ncbi:helix-turn-helix domain-containing protein [Nocardia sp. NPDC051832]|uniref:AraC-like ligand-binding domain-containing protein n=1 Tax=Nocardia sp. NPDC051832 TaxID=3155673 RepID=UPI003429F75F
MGDSEPIRSIELRSGSGVPVGAAVERWTGLLAEMYVPKAVSLRPTASFHGYISLGRYDDGVELSLRGSVAQVIRRTERLIAGAAAPFLVAAIQTRGVGRLHQGGRSAELTPGAMVFYDSGRPFRWEIDSDWEQVVVRVPLQTLCERSGVGPQDIPTAIGVAATSAAGVAAQFFSGVARVQRTAPRQAAQLAADSVALLASAVQLAAGAGPGNAPALGMTREQVLAFMSRHCADPALTVDAIARACAVSRRTLYRLFEGADGGIGAVLRRLRVERAQRLLCAAPAWPLSAVATASGFATERQFYRVFRNEIGVTPGEYRARCDCGMHCPNPGTGCQCEAST